MHPDRLDALTRRLGDATSRRGLLGILGGGVVGTAVATVGLSETRAKSNHKRRKRDKGNNGKGNNGGNHKNGPKNSGPFERMTDIPVSAHDQQGHNFQGFLDITEFAESAPGSGQIVARGTVTGKVTGKGIGNKPVTQNVELPVTVSDSGASVHSQVTCNILDLTLGPIHLDLLGLILDTNQIHIHLTANTAGGLLGSLLGQLLCGTPLPDLTGIVNLLNQILAILQGL
jgi:hypothetical protein